MSESYQKVWLFNCDSKVITIQIFYAENYDSNICNSEKTLFFDKKCFPGLKPQRLLGLKSVAYERRRFPVLFSTDRENTKNTSAVLVSIVSELINVDFARPIS